MEKNVGFECFDPSSKSATLCNLETDNAEQIKCKGGKFEPVKECIFFPSQIVVVEGRYFKQNNQFTCKNIYLDNFSEDILFSAKQITGQEDDRFYSIMTASGPFTFPDTFNDSPLKEFLAKVEEEKPHVAIICGPFLENNFEYIKSGEIQVTDSKSNLPLFLTYDEAFQYLMEQIEEVAAGL